MEKGSKESWRAGDGMNRMNRKGMKKTLCIALWAMAGAQLASAQIAPVSASIPFIAFGGSTAPGNVNSWTTEFTFTNLGSTAAALNLRWYGVTGQPLSVPVVGATRATTHQFVLAPSATLNFLLDNTEDALTSGWVAVDINGSVSGQAIFHYDLTGRPEYSTAAPLIRNGANNNLILLGGGVPVSTVATPVTLALPFNNVGNITGLSFANITSVAQVLTLNYLDLTGAVLMTQTTPLAPGALSALPTSDPRLANQKGTVVIAGDGSPYSAIAFVQGTGANSGTLATLLPITQ
jgi:hypothetical protein